jgi:bifunctional non-homologous end joining protein LigD
MGRRPHCGENEGLPLVKTRPVAQIDFLEWTADNHLRHTNFVALREDKLAQQIRRE